MLQSSIDSTNSAYCSPPLTNQSVYCHVVIIEQPRGILHIHCVEPVIRHHGPNVHLGSVQDDSELLMISTLTLNVRVSLEGGEFKRKEGKYLEEGTISLLPSSYSSSAEKQG